MNPPAVPNSSLIGGPVGSMSQSSNGTGGSSFSILSNHTAASNQLNGNALPGSLSSLTDVTLEKAMERVQELAQENANLREYLKENNANMKKQFQLLLKWKEKVRESNTNNLKKFEEMHHQIAVLKAENEKCRECLSSPGSVMEKLQEHIHRLEDEKHTTQREVEILRKKVKDLKSQLGNKSTDSETVFVNSTTSETELEAYKVRCAELASQVQNFHQQNEILMQDLQGMTEQKLVIQEENSRLNAENIQLQKKLQMFLGDMKAKHSVGGTAEEVCKSYDYSPTQDEEQERLSSATSKQDIEILQQQTTASDRLSGELAAGGFTELQDKLKKERNVVFQQKQKLSNQEVEISQFKAQLSEKERMLEHYQKQLDQKVAFSQQQERQQQDLLRQLDGLNAELQQTKSSMSHTGDVQSLKSQVMSLIKEVQETSTKYEAANKTLEKKSQRVLELEHHISHMAEEMQKNNSLIQSQKFTMASYEDTIGRERAEHATVKKQLTELQTSFNTLVSDYKELLDTFDEYKAQQQLQQPGQNKECMDEINRLTAQTIAAEEAITFRDEQIKQLKVENSRLKDDVDNTIPILKAQADVWKQDFDAERYARERQVAEKETLLQEMKNLELKNQQLLDELETYSRKSLAEMQRRHSPSSYQQQVHQHLQVGNKGQPHGAQWQPQQPAQGHPFQQAGQVGGYATGQGMVYPLPQGVGYPSPQGKGYQPPQGAGYQPGQGAGFRYPPQPGYQHQQPMEHGAGTEASVQGPPEHQANVSQQPRSMGSGSHGDDSDNQMVCPKCNRVCPDLDTLQIHVMDCIDN